jgi:hypothetical protein
MMQELAHVLLAIQVVQLAQVLLHAQVVMLESLEFLTILFVFVKMDILNLSSKMEQKFALNALLNALLALKVLLNVVVVTHQLIESKVMIH